MRSSGTTINKIMFAGPTLARLGDPRVAERAGFDVRSPVRRGDIAALLDKTPGVLVVVDGVFNQSLAVGHAELRSAIAAGWQVFGLSSMGAVRAFEMRNLGMIGFGRVYGHCYISRNHRFNQSRNP